jgi:hypothetical protein
MAVTQTKQSEEFVLTAKSPQMTTVMLLNVSRADRSKTNAIVP